MGGREIGAIMSFLGDNESDQDNAFAYRVLNEIEDESHGAIEFASYDGWTFAQLQESAEPGAQRFIKKFQKYEMTVVMLTDSISAHEFNLQFTRLNLGTIINSGEKLNAMVGDVAECMLCRRWAGRT